MAVGDVKKPSISDEPRLIAERVAKGYSADEPSRLMLIARKLVKKCLVLSHMRRACLTGPWREFEAGREVIVYGTKVEIKWDLFVREVD